MSFSDHLRSGFALAATIAKDAGAEKARAGLAAGSAEALTATARELASMPKAERRARVRALMSPSALPAPARTRTYAASEPPARALALLRLPGAAGEPRAGYSPDPRFIAVLQRIAARAGLATEDDAWRA